MLCAEIVLLLGVAVLFLPKGGSELVNLLSLFRFDVLTLIFKNVRLIRLGSDLGHVDWLFILMGRGRLLTGLVTAKEDGGAALPSAILRTFVLV